MSTDVSLVRRKVEEAAEAQHTAAQDVRTALQKMAAAVKAAAAEIKGALGGHTHTHTHILCEERKRKRTLVDFVCLFVVSEERRAF